MADPTEVSPVSVATGNGLDPGATEATSENARQGAQKRRDPNEPSAVVGIGASAGGIAPLQEFFEELNEDTGLAFVVVDRQVRLPHW